MGEDLTQLVERVESEPWGHLTPSAARVRNYAEHRRYRQALSVTAASVAAVAAVLAGVITTFGNPTATEMPAPPGGTGTVVASPAPVPARSVEPPFLDPGLVATLSAAMPTFPEIEPAKARALMRTCVDRDSPGNHDPAPASWTIAAAVRLPPITRTIAARADGAGNLVPDGRKVAAPPAAFIAAHQRGTGKAVWCVVSEETYGNAAGAGGVQPLWFSDHYLPGYVVPTSVRLISNDQQVQAGYVAEGVTRVNVSLRGVTYPSVVRDGFYFAVVPAPIDFRAFSRPPAVPTLITAYNAADKALGSTTNTTDFASDPTITHGCWVTPDGRRIRPLAPRRLGAAGPCGLARPWAGHID